MIEYFDERPDMHHEIGALDYMRFTGAPYLASIHSKLKSHKDDDRCHITDEERDKWNRKVDKSTFYELENKVLTKADKKEIPVRLSQLQNDTAFITAADINSRLIGEGYVTEDDLGDYAKKNELTGYISTWVNGQSYVTRTELNGTLGGYVTQRQLTEAIRGNMTPSDGGSIDIDLSEYAKKSELPGMATATVLGTVKAARTNNNMSSAYWPVKLTADGVAYVAPSLPEGDDSSISEEIVHSWVNAAFDEVAEDVIRQAVNSESLEEKITLIAGNVVTQQGGMTQAQVSALQLASDRAALLVTKGLIDETGNVRTLKSAGFIAAINGDTSAAQIKADKIFLDGETIADKIKATDMHLSGHIIAENLEIVKDSSNVWSFDENLYEKGDGVFAGNVIAKGYKTVAKQNNADRTFAGATQNVTINGTTLMFINGLFVGASTESNPVPEPEVNSENGISVGSGSPIVLTLEYQYNGNTTWVPAISRPGDVWTSGLDFTKNSLDGIRVTIQNPANGIGHTIHTNVWTTFKDNGTAIKRTQQIDIASGATETLTIDRNGISGTDWTNAKRKYNQLISEGKTQAMADHLATETVIAFLDGGSGQCTQYVPYFWWIA